VVSTALQFFGMNNRPKSCYKQKNQRTLFILALVNPLNKKGIIE